MLQEKIELIDVPNDCAGDDAANGNIGAGRGVRASARTPAVMAIDTPSFRDRTKAPQRLDPIGIGVAMSRNEMLPLSPTEPENAK